jgi:hypothetical protein
VLIPTKEQVYDFLKTPEGDDPEQPNRILGDFFEKEEIGHIDLTPLFRKHAGQKPRKRLDDKKDLYWHRNVHWNIKGNHLAALLVARHVLEKGLLDVPDRERKLGAIDEELAGFE